MLKTVNIIVVAVIAAGLVFYFFHGRDERGLGERLDDATTHMSQGLDEAAEQLEDRTPAEKLGDAVNDASRDLRNGTR